VVANAVPLISCLCVTRHRVDLLGRAVRCFREQTHGERELLVVYESDDTATRDYLASVADARVRGVEVPIAPKQTLGELRNLAIEQANGQYVCQWDDDDWHHPDRLKVQLEALRDSGRSACVLCRWTLADVEARRAYISPHRAWEGSILVQRDRMVPYPSLPRGEDTPAIEALADKQELHLLDRPDLYVYTYHGGNTWDRGHWSWLMQQSSVVPWREAQALFDRSEVPAVDRDALPMREHLAATRHWFGKACEASDDGVHTSFFRFGDMPVRMAVAGEALHGRLHKTFEHLAAAAGEVDEDGPFALRVDAWERRATGLGCPGVPFPPDRNALLDEGIITAYGDDRVIRYERGHYVNAIDRVAGHIVTWRADGHDQALYERSKPFPNLLEVWYRDHGVQQLHAGLVAHEGKGVLFIGQSGSGKSTCTLACALDGFDYLGDDHNGLQMTGDGRCLGHSFYNAARIGPTHLDHFPELRPHEVPPHNAYDHKSLVWMTDVAAAVGGGGVARSCEIVAVVMPRIVPEGPTRFAKASKVQTLIALAPSTLKVPMGAGLGGFMNLTDFIPKMPCYTLACGPDVRQIPAAVRALLAEAA